MVDLLESIALNPKLLVGELILYCHGHWGVGFYLKKQLIYLLCLRREDHTKSYTFLSQWEMIGLIHKSRHKLLSNSSWNATSISHIKKSLHLSKLLQRKLSFATKLKFLLYCLFYIEERLTVKGFNAGLTTLYIFTTNDLNLLLSVHHLFNHIIILIFFQWVFIFHGFVFFISLSLNQSNKLFSFISNNL